MSFLCGLLLKEWNCDLVENHIIQILSYNVLFMCFCSIFVTDDEDDDAGGAEGGDTQTTR
jgi:hypothetical protein